MKIYPELSLKDSLHIIHHGHTAVGKAEYKERLDGCLSIPSMDRVSGLPWKIPSWY
jgi:hypothetical protein